MGVKAGRALLRAWYPGFIVETLEALLAVLTPFLLSLGYLHPSYYSRIETVGKMACRCELLLYKHVISEVISFISHFLLRLFLCDDKSSARYRTEIISEVFYFLYVI